MEGKVKHVVPAGMVVDPNDGIEGFMPGSLVDTRFIPDFNQFLGETVRFKVIEFNREKDKIILSRKKVLEEESASRLRMEGLPEDTDRLPSTGPSPEQVYQDTHLDPDLQAALDELPPEFRAAVVLCDVEGLSYEEIGTTLDVKLGTVRSRIHRGRQMLKAAMEARREPAREESE